MPLNTSSTYRHLSKAMDEAYEISQQMQEPDIDLDLEGGGPTSLDHGSAALSAALQVVYLLAMDGAVLQQLQMVEDTARARLAARSLAFPAAPAPRPCDSWSQGAALWL